MRLIYVLGKIRLKYRWTRSLSDFNQKITKNGDWATISVHTPKTEAVRIRIRKSLTFP